MLYKHEVFSVRVPRWDIYSCYLPSRSLLAEYIQILYSNDSCVDLQ